MTRYGVLWNGLRRTAMLKTAIVAALKREVAGLIGNAKRIEREHDGRTFRFFELDETVVVCGGIGFQAARRAAEAVIALYDPSLLHSAGFAGALQSSLRVGDILLPAEVIDGRDGSRTRVEGGDGVLLTFMNVASMKQKRSLAQAYHAQAVDMEAAAVAAAARAHGIGFRAIKVISDEIDFEMPDMSRFIDERGAFKTASFAAHVAIRPWLWKRAAALGSNSSKAAKALAHCLIQSRFVTGRPAEAKTV